MLTANEGSRPSAGIMNEQTAQPSTTIKIKTPDGTLFVTIAEQESAPRQVILHIGKSGHSLQAWADALARVVSLALRSGLTLQSIIAEVSNISTDRKAFFNGTSIRSGPEGLAHALLMYLASKQGVQTDERPASMER